MRATSVVAVTTSVVALLLWAGTAAAQRDLAAELVGTWEGTQQQIGVKRGNETPSRERVLVIRSVKASQGGWIIDASYGLPGEKLQRFRPPTAQLTEAGKDVTLRLTYKSGTYVVLSLKDKDWLQGEYQYAEGGARPRTVSLKRVSTSPKP